METTAAFDSAFLAFEPYADACYDAIKAGKTTKEVFEYHRDRLVDSGVLWTKAANIARMRLEVMSRKHDGVSLYGEDAVPVILEFATKG